MEKIDYLSDSITVKSINKVLSRTIKYCNNAVRNSRFFHIAQGSMTYFYRFPLKTASIIITPIIFIKVILLAGFEPSAKLSDLALTLLFLFLATVGITSKAGWNDIKESSIFLKYIKNACKISV